MLLFSAYWIAPFLAIVLIDWHDRKGAVTHEGLFSLMDPKNLNTGWPALVSLVVGFGAMVPFMNTGLLVGPVANAGRGGPLLLCRFRSGLLRVLVAAQAGNPKRNGNLR